MDTTTTNETTTARESSRRDRMLHALSVFAEQRPGFEPANYFCGGDWRANRRNYDSDRRRALRQLNDARTLLAAVRWRTGIDADAIIDAAHTPGPYSVGRVRPSQRDGFACGRVDVLDPDLRLVASFWTVEIPTAECVANARMCAASDAMLDALRMALRHVAPGAMEYSNGTHGDRVYAADVIRAAIARATGDTP